ncbi:MAG TPA: serine/threonine-protein kinase [Polyangiaceae bacterium]
MNSSSPPPPRPKKGDPLVGQVVNGKYRIGALVASGGMGKIYRAEQLPLGRQVALKVLRAKPDHEGDEDPAFKKRFLREASILARLQHPNIVTVFDYGSIEGEEDERFFISMEYLSGESLANRIAERVSLSTRDTIRVAHQIARGLAEAHAHGVIHRDLKPSNVMLLPGRAGEEHVKIVDFGIVKIVGDESGEEDLTEEGSFIGSPKYMAPEQINRGGKIDLRTDVYAFGIILYQCLTGSVPFDAASPIQTLMAHLNAKPQPIRERAPTAEVPDWLDHLITSCMEKDPERRPQAMDAVARQLGDAEAAFASSALLSDMRNSSGSFASPDSVSGRMAGPPSGNRPLGGPGGGPGGGTGSGSHTTGGTFSSVNPDETEKTRTSPGQQPSKRDASPRRLVLASTVLALAAAGLFIVLRPTPQAPANDANDSAVARPAPQFTLRIESNPTGAEVREGAQVLGLTPLDVTIDNPAVRLMARRLTLVKEGYAPYTVEQGPSNDNIRLVAPLASVTPPPASASTPPGAGSTSSTGHAASPPPAPPAHHAAAAPSAKPAASAKPDLDIRLTR